VFRSVQRPTYDELVRSQTAGAMAQAGDPETELTALLGGGDTWTIL
jgi:2-oxoglutarate/2-oxoacid ferredoxin oxidoreductase subunit beta